MDSILMNVLILITFLVGIWEIGYKWVLIIEWGNGITNELSIYPSITPYLPIYLSTYYKKDLVTIYSMYVVTGNEDSWNHP